MKKSNIIKLFTFALLTVLVASCSKYEEGSKFTVLTKKARMANTWTLTSYTYNGGDNEVNSSNTIKWILEKEGSATGSFTNGAGTITDAGTWAFIDEKASIIISDIIGQNGTYEIVKLKNKDLKLRQTSTNNGNEVEEIWIFAGE